MKNLIQNVASHVAAGAIVGGMALALGPTSAGASDSNRADVPDSSETLTGELQRRQNRRRLQINRRGMLGLIGWSVANIAVGAYGWSVTDDKAKYFHQMNVMWNGVNALIGGFGYYGALNENPEGLTPIETIEKTRRFQQILVFNAGLDVAYTAGGAGLRALGQERGNEQYLGYGNSVMLQGGFLLLFDAILWGLHEASISDYKVNITQALPSGAGASLSFDF